MRATATATKPSWAPSARLLIDRKDIVLEPWAVWASSLVWWQFHGALHSLSLFTLLLLVCRFSAIGAHRECSHVASRLIIIWLFWLFCRKLRLTFSSHLLMLLWLVVLVLRVVILYSTISSCQWLIWVSCLPVAGCSIYWQRKWILFPFSLSFSLLVYGLVWSLILF